MFKFAGNKLMIGEIWHNGFALYKQTFAKVWFLVLIIMLVSSVPSMLHIDPHTLKAGHIGALVLLLIAILLIALFLSATILDRIQNLVSDAHYHISASLRYVLSKYLILLVSVLAAYCVILFAFVVFVLLSNILGTIALAIWALFAIFILISFMFAVPLILFDHKGCIEALKASYKLVWGNWWRTFFILAVPMFIMFTAEALVQTLIKNLVVTNLLIAVIGLIVIPYVQSLILVQFNDLKLRHN